MIVGKNILFILLIIVICLIVIIWYEETTDKKVPEKMPLIGIVTLFSFLWILFIINLYLNETKTLDLNSWGDFLAGFFAPILFFWVVFGIYLQKKELASALDALQAQQIEQSNSVDALRQQVVQTEIQQLNIWFNRNTTTANMLKNIIMANKKSIQQIFTDMDTDIKTVHNYFDLFDEIKNLIEIDSYMKEYLEDLQKNEMSDSLSKSIDDIITEYEVLFKIDIVYAKKILTIVYFLIFASDKVKEFEKFKIYSMWIKEKESYQNLLIIYNKGNFILTLKEIMKNYNKFDIDFKTGKLHGNI